jgi:hypothetical protein
MSLRWFILGVGLLITLLGAALLVLVKAHVLAGVAIVVTGAALAGVGALAMIGAVVVDTQ